MKKTKKKIVLRKKTPDRIIIDEDKNLTFQTEEELYEHFKPVIQKVESEYLSLLDKEDLTEEAQEELSMYLEETLDEPDFVWKDENTDHKMELHYYIKGFDHQDGFYYIAIAYVDSHNVPTFVLFHFATRDEELIKNYERGELIYDLEFELLKPGALDGDALSDGEPFAMGLYAAMLKIRSEGDIPQAKFADFAEYREETIESADEIWKKTDMDGNVLVTFIKEVSDATLGEMFYIAITLEEPTNQVHALLFSFPTTDENLVDRYRQGENLQAEEVTQESSH
jgi:hypothetical protein